MPLDMRIRYRLLDVLLSVGCILAVEIELHRSIGRPNWEFKSGVLSFMLLEP